MNVKRWLAYAVSYLVEMLTWAESLSTRKMTMYCLASYQQSATGHSFVTCVKLSFLAMPNSRVTCLLMWIASDLFVIYVCRNSVSLSVWRPTCSVMPVLGHISVTFVRKGLHTVIIWRFTWSLTQALRHMLAMCVKWRFPCLPIWRDIDSLTWVISLMFAMFVKLVLRDTQIFSDTWFPTAVANHTVVTYVRRDLPSLAVSRPTCWLTPLPSCISVTSVRRRLLIFVILRSIWLLTQTHTLVTSVKCNLLCVLTWRNIDSFTQTIGLMFAMFVALDLRDTQIFSDTWFLTVVANHTVVIYVKRSLPSLAVSRHTWLGNTESKVPHICDITNHRHYIPVLIWTMCYIGLCVKCLRNKFLWTVSRIITLHVFSTTCSCKECCILFHKDWVCTRSQSWYCTV